MVLFFGVVDFFTVELTHIKQSLLGDLVHENLRAGVG
jgi:hypothetical protein